MTVNAEFSTALELPAAFYRFRFPFSFEGMSGTISGFSDEDFHLYSEYRITAVLEIVAAASGYPAFAATLAEQGGITLKMEQFNR